MLVVNREGGGGTVALTEVKNANPDGYTIGFLSTGGVISAHMRKIPYDPVKDLEPIIQHAITVYGSVGFSFQNIARFDHLCQGQSYQGYLQHGRSRYSPTPGDDPARRSGEGQMDPYPHGGRSSGSNPTSRWPCHLRLTGSGVEALSQFGSASPTRSIQEKRMPEYPDVPTLIDLGYKIVAFNLYSVVGPKGMPQERVQMLHDAFFQGMQDSGYPEFLKKIDMQYGHRNPQDLRKFIKEIYDASGEILKNLKK